MDEIAMLGANAVSLSSKKHLLHHASCEDLMLMINLMNPKYYFPVKGEYRNQYANAEVAEEMFAKTKADAQKRYARLLALKENC